MELVPAPYLRLFRTVKFQITLFDIDINYGDIPLVFCPLNPVILLNNRKFCDRAMIEATNMDICMYVDIYLFTYIFLTLKIKKWKNVEKGMKKVIRISESLR